jgi:pyridoxal 5-phosphate dependent beta-lyase
VSGRLPHEEIGPRWAAARPRPTSTGETPLHMDTAACGRASRAVRDRIADHLALESERGGYLAQEAAAADLGEARALLGGLLGLRAADLAFVESSSAALAQFLLSWPLRDGDLVLAPPSEWGPNLTAFSDRGLRVELLDADPSGHVDVEALRKRLRTQRPAMVHLTAAAAHRALVQPVAAVAAACEPYEVPVVVDAAQGLGQIESPAPGAAAVYGTGRKYLCGPRGVGYLGVREPWQARLRPRAPARDMPAWPGEDGPVRRLESREAFVAGRVGLAVALREYADLGAGPVTERLAAIGSALRSTLAGLPGWRVCDPVGAPGSITSLAPSRAEVDLWRVRAQLLRGGVVGTVVPPERAPHELTGPMLRLSPHVDTTLEDIDRVAAVLAGVVR